MSDQVSLPMQIRDDLQALLDERAIVEVITRYSRGLDRCDEALLISCYHSDGIDDHGSFKGLGSDFAKYIVDRYRNGPMTQHVVTNIRIELDGDVAYGETYVEMRSAGVDGSPQSGFGRYIDVFTRRDGEWRISERRVTAENPSPGRDPSLFLASRQDRQDPSYSRQRI